MDRISNLPDEIIHLIVSFLSAKEAAFVPVLAKRFRNLFTIVKDLVLDAVKIPGIKGRFTDHVFGVLGQLETTTRIKKFTLNCPWGLDPVCVKDWLRNVLKRGLMEVELSIYGNGEHELPLEFFNCNTLVRVTLGSEIVIRVVPTNASLPALESVCLYSVQFEATRDCALNAFLLACPVLKELVIRGMNWETWRWSGILSSPTLRRLTLDRCTSEDFDGPDYQGITFETPSLTYFDYTDFVADAYPIVDFQSLVRAKLHLIVVADHQYRGYIADVGDPISSNPTNIINGIRNVQILKLSYPPTFDMLYLFREAIPVFKNLHRLTITHDESVEFCWRFLPFLLNKTPNLKTLFINRGLHYAEEDESPDYVCECVSGYDCLLSCPVEVLDVTLSSRRSKPQLEQVKHFLGKLSRLELLNIRSTGVISDRKQSNLLMLPRASPRCKINFI